MKILLCLLIYISVFTVLIGTTNSKKGTKPSRHASQSKSNLGLTANRKDWPKKITRHRKTHDSNHKDNVHRNQKLSGPLKPPIALSSKIGQSRKEKLRPLRGKGRRPGKLVHPLKTPSALQTKGRQSKTDRLRTFRGRKIRPRNNNHGNVTGKKPRNRIHPWKRPINNKEKGKTLRMDQKRGKRPKGTKTIKVSKSDNKIVKTTTGSPSSFTTSSMIPELTTYDKLYGNLYDTFVDPSGETFYIPDNGTVINLTQKVGILYVPNMLNVDSHPLTRNRNKFKNKVRRRGWLDAARPLDCIHMFRGSRCLARRSMCVLLDSTGEKCLKAKLHYFIKTMNNGSVVRRLSKEDYDIRLPENSPKNSEYKIYKAMTCTLDYSRKKETCVSFESLIKGLNSGLRKKIIKSFEKQVKRLGKMHVYDSIILGAHDDEESTAVMMLGQLIHFHNDRSCKAVANSIPFIQPYFREFAEPCTIEDFRKRQLK